MRYEHMRTRSASHAALEHGDRPASGMFSRGSALADLAYVALPGLTSRVARNHSVTSLANLGDTFSDMPQNESPIYVEGGTSHSLLCTVGVALLSTFMYGFNNGNMNTPAPAIRIALQIPAQALTLDGDPVLLPQNDTLWGFVVAIFSLGALLGCNSSPGMSDRWGRKTYLLWNSLIFTLGALLEAASSLPACEPSGGWVPCGQRVALLILGRAVSGVACGGATVVVPMYLGEISPAHLRGTFGTLNQLTMVVGMLLGQVLGLPSLMGGEGSWPALLALVLPAALLQLLLQPVLLESPRWYAMYGNEGMAEEQLVLLRDRPPDDAEVQEELWCMLTAVQTADEFHPGPLTRSSSSASFIGHSSSPHGSGSYGSYNPPANGRGGLDAGGVLASLSSLEGFGLPAHLQEQGSSSPLMSEGGESIWRAAATNPAVRRAMFLTVSLMVLQQLSGINNAFNFSTSFLKQNGLSDESCTLVAIAMNVANAVVTLVSVMLMDTAGRRPLLNFSILGMGLATAGLTISLGLSDAHTAGNLAAVCVIAFVSAFGIGLGPVPGLLPAEVFPAAHRSAGSGVACSAMWLANFISAQFFLVQAAALGAQAFVPHLLVLIAGGLFAFVAVPETRGKSLEQIEREMSAS